MKHELIVLSVSSESDTRAGKLEFSHITITRDDKPSMLHNSGS